MFEAKADLFIMTYKDAKVFFNRKRVLNSVRHLYEGNRDALYVPCYYVTDIGEKDDFIGVMVFTEGHPKLIVGGIGIIFEIRSWYSYKIHATIVDESFLGTINPKTNKIVNSEYILVDEELVYK